MGLSFVNLRGETVSTAPPIGVKRASSRAGSPSTFHKGWLVIGFSPKTLAAARAAHEAAPEEEGRPKKLFDEEFYMRSTPPDKVKSQRGGSKSFSVKTFEVESAAEECAEMLRAVGWKLVRAVPKAKEGK